MRTAPIAALILFGLTACGGRPVVNERVSTVSVPVIQKCASEKPAAVPGIRDRVDQARWDAMSPKQKAELVAAQALRRMNFSDELGAATSAC